MTESGRYPLTAIILTHNETTNVGDCLKSLDWVADVVVLDSGSSDNTLEAARQARPDVRIYTHSFQDFGDQRNWALDHTSPRHEWILFLDADERCTPPCADAIRRAIERAAGRAGFYLCYRNFFLGKWIKRCTYFPSWQLRLLRHGQVRFRKMGHGQSEVTDGELGFISEPYDHYGFSKGVADWIARHNRYSSEEVRYLAELRSQPLRLADLFSADSVRRRRCLKRVAARAPLRPWLKFVYAYFFRLGFLDGRAGLYFSLLRVAHEIHIVVKTAEWEWGDPRTKP
jgi:glycosyltransferase involved in cell wall biosynthesis